MTRQPTIMSVCVTLLLIIDLCKIGDGEVVKRGGVVHLGASRATLLSGGLNECLYAEDPSCTAGIQAVDAYARHLSKDWAPEADREPYLVVPFIDTVSPFINMNKWGLGMNMFLSKFLSYQTYFAPTELLTRSTGLKNDALIGVTDLQYEQFPWVYTNVAVPPANTWHEYTETVHFDLETGLAILYIGSEGHELGENAIDSAIGSLTYVAQINANNYCGDADANILIDWDLLDYDYNNSYQTRWRDRTRIQCFISVIYFDDDKNTGLFQSFLDEIKRFKYRPALVIDVNGNAPEYKEPTRVGPELFTWVVSYRLTQNNYYHHRITPSNETLKILDLEVIYRDLTSLPAEVADSEYKLGLDILAQLQNLTEIYDDVIGQTGEFPIVSAENGFRRCNAGECEIGNFYTDALRWHFKSDIAFLPAILFAGKGWAAGGVQESYLYEALPQTNYICNGTMSGSSLFQLVEYSVAQAAFEGTQTKTGGALLQVSGMKITYNTKLKGNRLVAIDIYNDKANAFMPLVPSALYTFATDSYVCKLNADFAKYTTSALTADGERPGEFDFETNQVVAELYLSFLDKPYNTSLQGRLQNATNILQALNLLQTRSDCVQAVTYWAPDLSLCLNCPLYSNVSLFNDTLPLEGQSGSSVVSTGYGYIINNNAYPVKVTPKADTFPVFIKYSMTVNGTNVDDKFVIIQPGMNVTIVFKVASTSLEAQKIERALAFRVESGGGQPGCIGEDSEFKMVLQVTPKENKHQIKDFRYIGFVLFFVILITALGFSAWVYRHSNLRVVMAMQPVFLYGICFGIIILAISIICLNIDDSLIASSEGCSRNCIARYWFLSLGFCISVSALFSKLWRINKLFSQQQFRRVQVRERDVILPFVVLITLNVIFLLTWSIADPLQWERITIEGRKWNTYGICTSRGAVGLTMMVLIGVVNFTALAITCWQAYLARNINSDFSEAKYLGIGLFSWAQVAIVGLPVLALLKKENPTARVFLLSAMIFVVSMSMMMIIFVPMILTTGQAKGSSIRISGMTSSGRHGESGSGSGSHSMGRGNDKVRLSGLESNSGASHYSQHHSKSTASTTSHFESIQEGPEASGCDDDDDNNNNNNNQHDDDHQVLEQAVRTGVVVESDEMEKQEAAPDAVEGQRHSHGANAC